MKTASLQIKNKQNPSHTNACIKKKIGTFFVLFFLSLAILHGPEEQQHKNDIKSEKSKKTKVEQKKSQDLTIPAPTLRPFRYKDFTNVWIADESGNPTGTHKDRFAQAILHKNKVAGRENNPPHASIISAGSAAIAIQTCLRRHNLPNLKVLVDHHTSSSAVGQMKELGCEVYQVDLGSSLLGPQDILRLTDNDEGFDITFERKHEILSDCYVDLAKAVINQQPDYIFIPYGSGLLYHNFFTAAKNAHLKRPPCLLGATVMSPESRATKLYSPYKSWPAFIKGFNSHTFIDSGVYDITDHYLVLAEKTLQKKGYTAEPSAASGLALLMKLEDRLPKDKKIVIVSTGMAKKPNEFSKQQKDNNQF